MIAGSQRHSSKVTQSSSSTPSPLLVPVSAPPHRPWRRAGVDIEPPSPQPASISFISLRLRTLDLSCAFFSRLDPLFSIACALFDQNTRGGIPSHASVRTISVSSMSLWQNQSYRSPLTTFRINTCKSVSKQSTLTPFRMNTYEKRGEGVPPSRVPLR